LLSHLNNVLPAQRLKAQEQTLDSLSESRHIKEIYSYHNENKLYKFFCRRYSQKLRKSEVSPSHLTR